MGINLLMFYRKLDRAQGFSLLELVVALIILGIASVMLVQVTGSLTRNSVSPVKSTTGHFSLVTSMEDISRTYEALVADADDNDDVLGSLKADIDASEFGAGIEAEYITFTGSDSPFTESPADSSSNILKVIITRDNETLVNIYTQ